jgi:hypothetical protein
VTDPLIQAVNEAFPDDAAEPAQPEPEAPPADEPDEPQPQDEPQPEPSGYVRGRFKSVEELEKAYDEIDRAFGDQGRRYGELQSQLEQQQQGQAPQQVPINQDTVDWFDEQSVDNPQGAAVWAIQNDPSGVLYNRAMDSWYEENPRQASRFERQIEMQAMYEYMQQQQQPLQEQAQRQEFVGTWARLKQEMPDLDDHADAILKAAQEAPEVLGALRSGTPEAQARTIRNLYKLAKFEQANQLTGQQPAEPAQTPPPPFVASQGNRMDPEVTTKAEQWARENLDPELEKYFGFSNFTE